MVASIPRFQKKSHWNADIQKEVDWVRTIANLVCCGDRNDVIILNLDSVTFTCKEGEEAKIFSMIPGWEYPRQRIRVSLEECNLILSAVHQIIWAEFFFANREKLANLNFTDAEELEIHWDGFELPRLI